MVVEGQISQAVGAIRVPLGLEGDAQALGPIRALFPHSPGDAMEPGVEQVDEEWGCHHS